MYRIINLGVGKMSNKDLTKRFDPIEKKEDVKSVLINVYNTLNERGYSPIDQIVGYLQSGDPAYIPRHNDARNQIRLLDRDDIMEELVNNYISNNIGTNDK